MASEEDIFRLTEAIEAHDFTYRFREMDVLLPVLVHETGGRPEIVDELYEEYCTYENQFGQCPLSDSGRIEFVRTYLRLGSQTDAEAVHADIADPVARIRSGLLFVKRKLRDPADVLASGKRDGLGADIHPTTEADVWRLLSAVASEYGDREQAAEFDTRCRWAEQRIWPAIEQSIDGSPPATRGTA